MKLIDMLKIYNFRNYKPELSSPYGYDTTIVRIVSVEENEEWFEFGVYDYAQENKSLVSRFINPTILECEVESFRMNSELGIVEIFIEQPSDPKISEEALKTAKIQWSDGNGKVR